MATPDTPVEVAQTPVETQQEATEERTYCQLSNKRKGREALPFLKRVKTVSYEIQKQTDLVKFEITQVLKTIKEAEERINKVLASSQLCETMKLLMMLKEGKRIIVPEDSDIADLVEAAQEEEDDFSDFDPLKDKYNLTNDEKYELIRFLKYRVVRGEARVSSNLSGIRSGPKNDDTNLEYDPEWGIDDVPEGFEVPECCDWAKVFGSEYTNGCYEDDVDWGDWDSTYAHVRVKLDVFTLQVVKPTNDFQMV
jgi:hypothetical protein